MENNTKQKVGAGILTVSIIQLVFSGIALVGFLILLLAKDAIETQLEAMGQNVALPTGILVPQLIVLIAVIIGIILILSKKVAGVYLYFVGEIAAVILSIVANGFRPFSILWSLILPVLMAVFIAQKKELYGFGPKELEE